MDPAFFNLKKQWAVCAAAMALLALGLMCFSGAPILQRIIMSVAILVLFVQFVWSGAYSIAALLTGKSKYFFQLLALAVVAISCMSIALVLWMKTLG
jgi:hypothetical protein